MSFAVGDFPDPPKGSPGGIRAAARSIEDAGRDFETASRGLTAASGALQADWQGWAAGTYLSCSRGLSTAIQTGADTFEPCGKAISAYADVLDATQDEIKRLRTLWVAAKQKEAAAGNALSGLAGQLLSAKPAEASGIEDRMSAAGDAEAAAGDEAAKLMRKAYEELEEFERKAKEQEDVLSGDSLSPFSGALGLGAGPFAAGVGSGLLGPGFGVPPGGLGYFSGVVGVDHPMYESENGALWRFFGGADSEMVEDEGAATNIPGFLGFWEVKNGVQNGSAEPDHSLLNPVDLAVTIATGGLAGAARKGLTSAAERIAGGLSLTGRREAVEMATLQAEREVAAVLAAPTRNRAAAIKAAGIDAAAKKELEIDASQARSIKSALDLAGKAGVPLPPAAAEIADNLIGNQAVYRYYVQAQLLRAQLWLEGKGGASAARAAEALERARQAVTR